MENNKEWGERRSGVDRRSDIPRRKELRNEPGKPPRRTSKDRRSNSVKL